MMKTNRSILLIFATISLLTHSCFEIQSMQTSVASSHSLETNHEFEIVWEKEGYWIYRDEEMPRIIGAPDMILIEGRDGEYQSPFITRLDSATGDVIWEKSVWPNHQGPILVHNNTLFRGTFGAAIIQAFNINTGELIWDTALPKAHSTQGLYYENNKLFVFTSDNEFFILDEMGEIISTSHEAFRTYLIIDRVLYGEDFSSIRAVDAFSRNEVWRSEIGKRFSEFPIFDNGTFFLRTKFIPNDVYSINQPTGTINWKVSQDVLSNLYVTDKKIYFLSYGGELVVLDRHSGEEISRDKFSPPFDLDKQNGGYFITGDPINNMLAIAFGDNAQIMGLEIKNP